MAISILAAAPAIAQPAASPVFVVFLEIHFDVVGRPTLTVSQVVDPAVDPGKPLAIAIPDSFLAGVREKIARDPAPRDGKPAFTYVFFDPTQPAILDLDLVTRASIGRHTDLTPDTDVVIKEGPDGWTPVSRRPVEDSTLPPLESLALDGIDGKAAGVTRRSGKVAPPAAGELRLTWRRVAGRPDSLLTIFNGYDRWLQYSAFLTRTPDGRPERTSTCVIEAGKRGIEHWPFRLETLRVSSFRLGSGPPPVPSCR